MGFFLGGGQGDSLPHSRTGFQSSGAEMSHIFLCDGEDSRLISKELLGTCFRESHLGKKPQSAGRAFFCGWSPVTFFSKSLLPYPNRDVVKYPWLCPSPFPSPSRSSQEAQKQMSRFLVAITKGYQCHIFCLFTHSRFHFTLLSFSPLS